MTESVEDRVRTYVSHGLEKSMLLKDPGGWPDHDEVSDHIDRMSNSELLSYVSMAVDDLLAEASNDRR